LEHNDIKDVDYWLKLAAESNYKASGLCKALNVSRRQLERYTREFFHCGPQEWLSEQRLQKAAALLKGSRRGKAVSVQLGFKQTSHFSREFKLYYGLSPRAFLAWSDRQEAPGHLPLTKSPGTRPVLFRSGSTFE
jgi:AraC-like DNA-binding protein